MKNKFSNPLAEFPREVGVLVFASFFVAVGFGIISPTLPLFARSFGVNHAQVGAILATFAFARFATGLISGKLVDHFGERLVYSFGIGFVSLTSFAAGLAQNYEQLLVFRAVGGFGSSMFSVAAGSILLRAVDDDHRARAQSLYNGSFLVGMMAGPVVGGAPAILSAFNSFIRSALFSCHSFAFPSFLPSLRRPVLPSPLPRSRSSCLPSFLPSFLPSSLP